DYLVALMTGYGKPASYTQDDKGHLKPAAPGAAGAGVMQCVSITHGEGGKPDECNKLADGMHYNAAFPGHQIAMANPFDGHTADSPRVAYQDGTPGTIENYSKDVAAFLSWASDPSLNTRKQTGWLVLVYLLITSVLLYIAKRRIWSGVKH
ncbi:MAG TPA: cytochrome c1, partial [Hyphomicrobiaceae bacterium]|nr:cytochrome c1 [Hyphomicrobiaceae bacterium]